MSSHPTAATDTCSRHPVPGDPDTMEGYRRLARIIAGFVMDASAEPISTGDAGDEAAEE